MSASSPPPSSTSSEPAYHRPSHRRDFQIAIICALSLEYDAATLLVDEFWDDNRQYGKTSGDTNFYRNGRIGMHNVVLMLLPSMGKAAVAGSAASLRTSYTSLRVAFLVGVCGGVPMLGSNEALLGDVVIGEAIIQYDFGRQYPGEFILKETAVATQSLPNKDIRTLLAYLKSDTGKNDLRQNTARHLKTLQGAAIMKEFQYSYRYPGFAEDKLFAATYRHKHRGGSLADPCCSVSGSYCDKAALSSCSELGCEENNLVLRQRLEKKQHLPEEEAQSPDIFIGRIASADTVMKSGDHRDQIAKQYNIIAFEMEGAGLWDEVPCIVVKGICDYADSHKNKIWQPFAAATAAAVVKAILARYHIADHVQLSASSGDSGQHRHTPPAQPRATDVVTRKSSSAAALVTSVQPNGAQTLQGAILDFQKALTDAQRHELRCVKTVPEADAVLIFTAELDSLNRNRKGRSIASRLYSVLQSVRDFSATVAALGSTHLGIAPLIWGSVKLTMFVAVKFVAYYEALSKFFMDLGDISIARQILSSSDFSEEIETLLDRTLLNSASGLDELSKLLQGIASSFKILYVVIDGLDECAKQDRKDLLAVLSSIVNIRPNTKLFLAGRESVSREVQREFPTCKQLSMDCLSTQSDIAAYVEGIVQEKLQNEELIVGDPDLIEEIKVALSKGANGMFLWVAFQVDELSLQHCDNDIRAAIQNLPKSLEETFDRAIDRVVSRGNANIAKQIFRWIATAKEPLTLDQLREVMFIEIGQQYSKPERRSNGIDHITSWCENLVHIDEELNTVQFVHQTVQQFFFKKCSEDRNNQFCIKLEDADHYLGEICVTYLNFNDFQTTLARRQQPLPPMPPIAIAGTALRPKWKAAASIPTLWKFTLDTRAGSIATNAVEALASFHRDGTGESKERLRMGHPFLGYASIHWISHTSMFQKAKSKTWNLWEKMILGGHDLAMRPWDEDSKSILQWSHKFRHYALIRLLSQVNMITTKDKNGILLDAASEGDGTLLSIILETKDQDLEMSQACLVAARACHLGIIKRLLIAGADGQTAIQRAARGGILNDIRTLLAAGVDGQIALLAAAKSGDRDTIKLLLTSGVDGQIALLAAAKSGDRDTIKLLLASGSDGQIALQAAARGGDLDATRQLLAADIDGRMALEAFAKNSHLDVIEVLLAAGADINAKDKYGGTALYTAAGRGHLDIIKVLLAAGADINAKDIYGETALYTAAGRGHLDIIKVLLAAGADINAKDKYGGTALYNAAGRGHLDIVKVLLAAGADINAKDEYSGTALYIAARNGHLDVINVLLAAGADINAKNN
ncbi:hypothetical protein TrVFT333_003411 [Trichoderma virens FT-333]|nr:hypothetical protein TrVFT333_003411 [Trichoderma virens FT-333]